MSHSSRKSEQRSVVVDPDPKYELSPYLFMQFMEPLGTTDGSVEAAWDFQRECWREDVVAAARALAPTMLRWGGIFCSYYRWREAVGPRSRRKPVYNLHWGGVETNQVGTHEFVDFCRTIGAEPLLGVNFGSEGRKHWARPLKGGIRSAGPREAADWVDYCNNPGNRERRANGAKRPLGVRFWQIGNETSYGRSGYDCEVAARRTLEFAGAMRRADPEVTLIGWGDSGWAKRMLEVAGAELQYIACHHFFGPGPDSPLAGLRYRHDPAGAWQCLMDAWESTDVKIRQMRSQIAGHPVGLALTESHFALPGRNRGEVLSTWAAGVAYARILNVHARHGEVLKIANLADFCGTRWMVNAIMIPTPQGGPRAYLMPVAQVISLLRHHVGRHAVGVASAPHALDVTASRTGKRLFLHVVNTSRTETIRARIKVVGMRTRGGRAFQIADDPWREIDETAPDLFSPAEHALPSSGNCRFPPASVTALELSLEGLPRPG